MQKDLSRLTRELQKETCPCRVLDEVQRRVGRRDSSRAWLRCAIPAATAALMLAVGVLIWRWESEQNARLARESPARLALDRVRVANQAADALELIGSIAARAGVQSQKAISDRAVPPLRNSLQAAENKIIHHIEL
jgi:anti-sigma factor RsiW